MSVKASSHVSNSTRECKDVYMLGAAMATAQLALLYRDVSFLTLPLDEELHHLDSIELVVPDCLQLVQTVCIIASPSIPKHWLVDLFSWPEITNTVVAHEFD